MNKKEYIQPTLRCAMIACSRIMAGSIKTSDTDADPNATMMSKGIFEYIGDASEEE